MNLSRRTFAAKCLCLAVSISAADGAPADPAPPLPPREQAIILEAYNLWSALADEVWPGASSVKAPFVYVANRHEYALGFPEHLAGFRDTGDRLLGKPIQVRERTLPVDIGASFPLQGIPAVLMGSPEAQGKSLGNWVITAGHEMFHVFQAANRGYDKASEAAIGPAGDSSWHLTFPFPYSDADAMRLLHLQGYLVWLAAQSSNPDEAKYNIGTALDAARVYNSYLARLTNDRKAYRYSQFQEWTEGVAAYFEYRLAQRAGTGAYRPTTAYSSLPAFQPYADLWRDAYASRPFLTKHAGRAAKNRNAFYHLGAGKALALDKVNAEWRSRYFSPGVWLDDLLAEAIQGGH